MIAGSVLQARYELRTPLGEGGMATTWVAHDRLEDCSLALKLLRFADDSRRLGMFRDEFASLRGLYHPQLTRVHDLGSDVVSGQRVHFYTSELVRGVPLKQYARGRTFAEVVPSFTDALSALAFLHRVGLRHGDFTPANIVVDDRGRGVLIDLGCVTPLVTEAKDHVSGTPGFIAPELLQGKPADGRADLYAAGQTLTWLSRHSALPAKLTELVSRLCSAVPSARPSTTEEVLEYLGVREPLPGPPRGRAPRLIGRAAEMSVFQELFSALCEARQGPRGLVVVGPSGVGKSRLVSEMKWVAQLASTTLAASGRAARPVSYLLRALAADPALQADAEGVLAARQQLLTRREPVVIVLDDVELLSDGERDALFGLLRTLEPDDPLLVVCASSSVPSLDSRWVRTLALEPLHQQDVAAWAGNLVSPARIADLRAITGGFPSYIEAYLARLAEGELAGDELDGAPRITSTASTRALSQLDPDERHALGVLAVFAGSCTDEQRRAFGVTDRAILHLLRLSWVMSDGAAFKLTRSADIAAIVQLLGESAMAALHRRAAESLTAGSDPAGVAWHLAACGDLLAAGSMLLERDRSGSELPWRRVAAHLIERHPDARVCLSAAELLLDAGRFADALRGLARLRRKLIDGADLARLHRLAGTCYLRLGRAQAAIRQLRRALALHPPQEEKSAISEVLARVLIQKGSYADALALAESEIVEARGRTAMLLHEDAGVAAGYLGAASARAHLDAAARASAESGDERARARVLSYLAISDFRAGRIEAAIAGHRSALALAERHRFADLQASAALNLGTACQQHGDWGEALECYERGLRLARVIGRQSTELTLRFNIANLQAMIGLAERAEEAMRQVWTAARRAGQHTLAGPAALVLAEVQTLRGRFDAAREWLSHARASTEEHGGLRERWEIELERARIELAAARPLEAQALAAAVRSEIDGADAPDLAAALLGIEARIALLLGRQDVDVGALEAALEEAQQRGRRAEDAELAAILGRALEVSGAAALAGTYFARARAGWEHIARSLPEQLAPAFWAHPLRSELTSASTLPIGPRRELESESSRSIWSRPSVRRFLEVNRRLNSSLSTDSVLEYALDAAIELTSAARGFILLKPDTPAQKQFQIPVARNLDRESIRATDMKFSHRIAESVIASGEPIATADACVDDRFRAHTSVHAMRLRSIVCVPIRAPEGVLGALYLDHSIQAGLFDRENVELLLAFGDQVAIALRNARLLAAVENRSRELEQRTRELEREQERVQELLCEREQEIGRLHEEVRLRQADLELRFDYQQIVGRSAAMRRMLATLDRVVEVPVGVLIEGESGTGKELVAKALHFNGPRKSGRFVGVNCGALPDALLEAELFGFVRGAFTGAEQAREGLLVAANGGTLFLDEIGEMPLHMQVKLLRVLQEREVRPLGSTHSIAFDARVLCATNRDLHEEVGRGRFREDLYYRLAVVRVRVPPLRERSEDIPALARHFLERFTERSGLPAPKLGRDVLSALARHPWPGNVRQLENAITRAAVMAGRDRITLEDLDLPALTPAARVKPSLKRTRAEYEAAEAERLLEALNDSRWNVRAVCRQLGIPSNTLYRKLAKYGITRSP